MLTFDICPINFRAEFFETKPRLQRAALTERPFAWADLDQLLSLIEPGESTVRLLDPKPVSPAMYVEDAIELGQRRRRLNKAQFYEYMRRGATLVINRFESHSVTARRLCAEVAGFARLQTTGNAYLSFGGRGAFGKHWDTHDVFAIQLIGRKRWQVFEPTFPLPLSFQSSERVASDDVTRPVLDCVLEAGDMLYVPRGWWHQTLPLQEGSFHLSVGSYAATVYDYFMWVCAGRLSTMESARRAFDASAGDEERLAELSQVLAAAVRDPSVREAFRNELIQRERVSAEFRLGLFLDSGSAGLRGAEVIRMTNYLPQRLDRPQVVVNGVRIDLDPVSHAVLQALRDAMLPFHALCTRLPDIPRDRLHRAVLELAQRDVVTIEADT